MKKVLFTVALSGILAGFTASASSILDSPYFTNVHIEPFYHTAMDTWERRYPWSSGYHNVRSVTGIAQNKVLTKLEWSASVCHNPPYVDISDTAHLRLESFQDGISLYLNHTESFTLLKSEMCKKISGTIDYQGLNLKLEDVPQFTLHAWADAGHSDSVGISNFSYRIY